MLMKERNKVFNTLESSANNLGKDTGFAVKFQDLENKIMDYETELRAIAGAGEYGLRWNGGSVVMRSRMELLWMYGKTEDV